MNICLRRLSRGLFVACRAQRSALAQRPSSSSAPYLCHQQTQQQRQQQRAQPDAFRARQTSSGPLLPPRAPPLGSRRGDSHVAHAAPPEGAMGRASGEKAAAAGEEAAVVAASAPSPAEGGAGAEGDSPQPKRARRASGAASPRAAKGPRAKLAAGASGEGKDGEGEGDEGEGAAEKAPAAKKPRARAPSTKAGKAAAAGGEEGEAKVEAGAALAKPARARKAPAKKEAPAVAAAAAAAGADADADADAAEAGEQPAATSTTAPDGGPFYSAAIRRPPPPEGTPTLKILTWNVAGLRALLKKDPSAVSRLVEQEAVDVLCLQEHKLQGGHTAKAEEELGLKGWTHTWACSTGKLGYSGVHIATRVPPLAVSVGLGGATPSVAAGGDGGGGQDGEAGEHEVEGRVVTVELPDVVVVSCYVPNSGEGLKRLEYRTQRWDGALAAYLVELQARRGKPLVLTGDLNCAHKDIDIHNPKGNLRSAGFTIEERESFGALLLGRVGLVDTYRALYPGLPAYTYYTYKFNCRAKNKGWRLDYFLASASLMPPGEVTPLVPPPPEQQPAKGKRPAKVKPEEEEAARRAAEAAAAAAAKVPEAAAPATDWRVWDSWIRQDVFGSDHLPLGLTLVRKG